MKLPTSATYGFWLAIIRIYTGAFWLMHGIPKFTQSDMFMPPSGMIVTFVNDAILHTHGFYQTFLTSVVLPNINLFAELVRLGEVVTGALLFFGAFTRLGGIIGVLLAINYLSAKGGLGHLVVWSGIDSAALVLSFISLVLPTGRVLGIDAILARRAAVPQPVVAAQAPPPMAAEFVDEKPLTGPSAPPT